jgi:hypothetical protein
MSVPPDYEEIVNFASVVTAALLRAEGVGRVPARFTGTGSQFWTAFRNELTSADLLDLAVRDAAMTMPQPFALHWLWPEAAGDDLRIIPPEQVEEWIKQAKDLADQSPDAYLRAQAHSLGIRLPWEKGLEGLPMPEAHHHILELPGSGGWLAYHIAARPGAAVYYWENFTIACGTWQEQLMAGLIAFELGAPPHRELAIVNDPTLVSVLGDEAAFDWIVGLREDNARRADALRSFLKPEGQVVLV